MSENTAAQKDHKDSVISEVDTLSIHIYVKAGKCVKSVKDMYLWEQSTAYFDIVGFINSVSLEIQGIKNTDNMPISPIVRHLIDIFDKLTQLVTDTPPVDQPQRFGNKAYKEWFDRMTECAPTMLENALPTEYHDAIIELESYFTESFGNQTRIDYGTGHELAFVMFLCCLFKIGALVESDQKTVGTKLFHAYIKFVRKLQLTYRMEPAGSHGVWSLDDYQFVPFIWGSAQLCLDSPIQPSSFLDEVYISEYKNDYLFMGCIDYINQVKTGHFAEHSNQLWSISAVQSWTKIHSGLMKMYQKEILSKFPVIQHVLFGSILEFKNVHPGAQLNSARLGIPAAQLRAAMTSQNK